MRAGWCEQACCWLVVGWLCSWAARLSCLQLGSHSIIHAPAAPAWLVKLHCLAVLGCVPLIFLAADSFMPKRGKKGDEEEEGKGVIHEE